LTYHIHSITHPVVLGAFLAKRLEPARDEVRETLNSFVIGRLKEGGGEPTVPYKPQGGGAVNAKVDSATEEGLHLSADGKSYSASWEELGDAGLYELTRALLGRAINAVTVACLLMGGRATQWE